MKLINAVLVLILLLGGATPLMAQTEGQPDEINKDVRRGEVVVEIKAGASIEAINARFGTTTIERLYGTNFYRLLTPKAKKEKKWRKKLSKDRDVLSASLNPVITSPSLFGRSTFSFPDGVASPGLSLLDYNSQQALFDLLALEQVSIRSRGANIVVALIDTGINFAHPQIAGQIWKDERRNADIEGDGIDNDGDGLVDDARGWDFVDNDNDPSEEADDPETTVAGHGTFIGGLINMLAPDCRILPVRAFPPEGMSDAFTVAAAIKYAVDHGANVINLSLGSPEVSPLLEDAINYAKERGIVMVAAVGNDNTAKPAMYPSSSPDVIAVAAINLDGRKSEFSNFGKHVDVCAPGTKLISAYPGTDPADDPSNYARWSGTSFAAPFASAEAALLLSADSRFPDVDRLITGTAVNLDDINPEYAGKLGKGRIDPLAALQAQLIQDRPSFNHIELELMRGPSVGSGRGRASITVTGSTQEFVLEAIGLNVRSTYDLFVDDREVGADLSASLGGLKFKFSTAPGEAPLPAPLDPLTTIKRVELRDALGRIILQGDFSTDGPGPEPVIRSLEKEARLASTLGLADAGGRARISIESDRERLGIEVEGLNSGETYRVVADGVTIGLVAARFGYARVLFANDGVGQPLPPLPGQIDSIRHIEIQDLLGQTVMQGDFRTGIR